MSGSEVVDPLGWRFVSLLSLPQFELSPIDEHRSINVLLYHVAVAARHVLFRERAGGAVEERGRETVGCVRILDNPPSRLVTRLVRPPCTQSVYARVCV